MKTRGPLVAAAWIVVTSLGCPRPLAAPSDGPHSITRVPADTVVEVTLTDLARGRALLSTLLALVDADDGLLPGARQGLTRALGIDPFQTGLFALAGVDDTRPVTLARRRGGSVYAIVPSHAPARTLAAWATSSDLVVDGQPSRTVARLVDTRGDVVGLARLGHDHLSLALTTVDALGDAAILAAADDVMLHRAARVADPARAAVFAISESALSLIEPPTARADPFVVTGSIDATSDSLSIAIAFGEARAQVPAPWRAGCALVDAAAFRVRLPAPLLAQMLGDDERLTGDVEIIGLGPTGERISVDEPPDLASALGLVVVGRPRDADAVRSLRASVAPSVDDRPLVVARSAGANGPSVAAFVDDTRFLFSTRGEHDVLALVEAPPCDRGDPALFVDGARTRAILARKGGPPDPDDAGAALRRMMARALSSIDRIEAAPTDDGRGLDVTVSLSQKGP